MSTELNLFAKFGRIEDLESIKKGKLYFNPIQKYRDDGTDFRGDSNEGVLPLDPFKITIRDKDGRDIFTDLEIPSPTRVMQSIQNDDNTFIFCSARISMDVFTQHFERNETYVLSDQFKSAIQHFGDHVLIFDMVEIHRRIDSLLKKSEKTFYISRNIIYRDLGDYTEATDYHTAYKVNNSRYDRYFVKDLKYKNQSEWRILIDGLDEPLQANCGEGFSLDIGKLDYAYLFKTSTFLDTFQYNGEKQ